MKDRIELAQALAHRVALAVDNARLRHDLEEEAGEAHAAGGAQGGLGDAVAGAAAGLAHASPR